MLVDLHDGRLEEVYGWDGGDDGGVDFLCCRPSLPGWCQLIGFTYLGVQAGHGTEKAIYDVEDG